MDEWTNGRTKIPRVLQDFIPFGATTQKPVIQGDHTVSTLALLKYSVIYMNVKQGSGPDRGRSPAEWGEIPSVHPYIRPPIRLPYEGSESSWRGQRAS